MNGMPERPLMGALKDMADAQGDPSDGGDEQEATFPVTPEGFKMAQMMAKKTGGTVAYCVEPPQAPSDQQDAGPAPRGI